MSGSSGTTTRYDNSKSRWVSIQQFVSGHWPAQSDRHHVEPAPGIGLAARWALSPACRGTAMKRLLIAAVALFCPFLGSAAAQIADARFEVGGQVSTLRLGTYNATNPGFGGRFGYEANRLVTLEGEFN